MEKIAVIGVGRLGLCFALLLEKAGYEVLGIDNDEGYVNAINEKVFLSVEPGVTEALQASRHLRCTNDTGTLVDFDASLIFIAVPTPSDMEAGYDHRIVDSVLSQLYTLNANGTRKDLVVQCTVLPGYCDQQTPAAANHGCYISYKPEFIAQGSIMADLQYPDQLLIGAADDNAALKITDVYSRICQSQPAIFRMSRFSAEIAKLATNCYLTMKIAFANSLGDLSEKVGAETESILRLVGADSRIGNKFLQYGYGFGGPCFPRDNRAMSSFAANVGVELYLSRATEASNQQHLDFQFNEYMQKYKTPNHVDFYSVTYKPGTPILEESQPLALAVRLAKAGQQVVIHESRLVIQQLRNIYGNLFCYVEKD